MSSPGCCCPSLRPPCLLQLVQPTGLRLWAQPGLRRPPAGSGGAGVAPMGGGGTHLQPQLGGFGLLLSPQAPGPSQAMGFSELSLSLAAGGSRGGESLEQAVLTESGFMSWGGKRKGRICGFVLFCTWGLRGGLWGLLCGSWDRALRELGAVGRMCSFQRDTSLPLPHPHWAGAQPLADKALLAD